MKEFINVLVEAYRDDKKEFIGGVLFAIFWLAFIYFMFWFFIPTFAYDMG